MLFRTTHTHPYKIQTYFKHRFFSFLFFLNETTTILNLKLKMLENCYDTHVAFSFDFGESKIQL